MCGGPTAAHRASGEVTSNHSLFLKWDNFADAKSMHVRHLVALPGIYGFQKSRSGCSCGFFKVKYLSYPP